MRECRLMQRRARKLERIVNMRRERPLGNRSNSRPWRIKQFAVREHRKLAHPNFANILMEIAINA